MSLGRVHSVSLRGLSGTLVDIEADISSGLPSMRIVGLADTAVSQAEHRVRAAFANSGLSFPDTRVTVNLAPAGVPKHGTAFDAAIAVAILRAQGAVPHEERDADVVVIGEVSLDGRILPVRGVLPSVLAVREQTSRVIVPRANLAEGRLVDGLEVQGAASLRDLARSLGADLGGEALSEADEPDPQSAPSAPAPEDLGDLADVIGQPEAVEALIVAATGRHHMLMVGSPGAGKTLLAKCLPGVLPPLSRAEALEATALRSLATQTGVQSLVRLPPLEAPHQSVTITALLGGGGIPRPGVASLSTHGVLFLDEAPEFRSEVLDSLRQSLESGRIIVHRAAAVSEFPASFQLVLAANPCPCGNAMSTDVACTCTPQARQRYLRRLSGPLLDRIDVQVRMQRVRHIERADNVRVTSAATRERVVAARARAAARLEPFGVAVNAHVPGDVLRSALRLSPTATATLDNALDRGLLTLRGYDRALRVAWSIADLADADRPEPEHIAQALQWRRAAA